MPENHLRTCIKLHSQHNNKDFPLAYLHYRIRKNYLPVYCVVKRNYGNLIKVHIDAAVDKIAPLRQTGSSACLRIYIHVTSMQRTWTVYITLINAVAAIGHSDRFYTYVYFCM